ncbi:MAG: InlB B-repeat-containing protein, partial [Candidatus Bathyarchaeota archaeon]|nr:InlB B-repeat-containing protein [Candidatus Termitimicrobium sp.]
MLTANAADPVFVGTETDLRAAITNAAGPTIIALNNDIQLTNTPLSITSGKDITLISNDGTGVFFKLIGVSGINTITINSGGALELDGIVVTHNSGELGRGVYVDFGATLTLSSGEITENDIYTGGTISDAQYGGGVYNWGTFTMNGGTISQNSAYNGAGVYSIISFTMNDGIFSENTAAGAGGGVANLGTLVINNGTFYRNQAVNGAGVYSGVYSTFTLTNGAFLENQAVNGAGGGVYNDAYSTFTLIDGLFSRNQAVTGGGVYNLGPFDMIGGIIGGPTIADGNIATDDGGGVCDNGHFSVFNMYGGMIANNTASNYGGGVESAAGVFNMFGGEIADNHAGFGGGVFIWDISTVNMEGGTLFGNTATYYGGGVYNFGGTFTVFSADVVIANNSAGYDGGGVYNDGSFIMAGNAVIANNTATDNGGGVYNAGPNAKFTMTGGIIGGEGGIGGNSAYDGGGVYNDQGTFTMSGNATVLGNRATFGGGVYNNGGLFDLGDPASLEIVRISGNTATSNGGGVYNTGATALFNMFSNAVISNNTAGIDGGGVFNVNAGVFNMFGGEIVSNSAGTGGGGVDTSGEFTMYDGKISFNTAHGAAGVLNYHNFNMLGGEITNNTSTGYGGGVENNGSSALGLATFNMYGNTIIANNTAIYGGGGVYNSDNAIFNMHNSALISDNRAVGSSSSDGRGGGVHNSNNATLNMFDSAVILDNFALYGGGVFNDFNCTTAMANDSAILDNTATYYGGAVYNWNPYTTTPSLISMTDRATISGNSATYYGGGIQNTDNGLIRLSGEAIISNNSALYGGGIYTISTLPNAVIINGGIIANNSARSGGGIYTNSQLTMTNGIIANNTAVVDGGGMYIASAGFVELLTGSVYGNVAGNNGGGIWVAYANLNHLFVFDGMIFSNNRASMAYNRNPIDDALYHAQIGANVVWTVPFTQGYNNYDISYTNGTPFILYTVTVIDSYAPITGAGEYQAGETVTIDAGVRPGYTFVGWIVNEGGITVPDAQIATFTMPPNDVVVTALWSPNIYHIFYVLNGGINDPSNPNTYTEADLPLPIANPTRPGYTFEGWTVQYTDGQPDITQPTPDYIIPVGTTGDITLTAHWLEEPTQSSFSVTKLTNPAGSPTVFNFVTSAPPGSFSLTDGTTWNSGNLAPGSYTVTEIAQAGWDLTNIIINDPTNNSYVDLATRTVFINLDQGETISILYQNTEQAPQTGSITVLKTTCPTDTANSF